MTIVEIHYFEVTVTSLYSPPLRLKFFISGRNKKVYYEQFKKNQGFRAKNSEQVFHKHLRTAVEQLRI